MVNDVVVSLGKIKTNVDAIFSSWYGGILKLNEAIGVVENTPRKTSFQRNKSNTAGSSPSEHYKQAIAIPVLDSFTAHLKERFNSENAANTRKPLSLIPSVTSGKNHFHEMNGDVGMAQWK